MRAEQIQPPQLRQAREVRRPASEMPVPSSASSVRFVSPARLLHALIGDGRAGRDTASSAPLMRPDVAQAAIVEEAVVAEIEVLQLRERRERVARAAASGAAASPRDRGSVASLLENRIFQRNVGLDRLAQDELLEIGRRGEQSDRVGDERRRLVVPKPAVDDRAL